MLIKRPSMAERIDELSGPVVENWRTDPRLTALWLQQMQSFTDATIAQIRSDPHASARLAGHDISTVASTLAWGACLLPRGARHASVRQRGHARRHAAPHLDLHALRRTSRPERHLIRALVRDPTRR
jgi:hypothetical protein